ncbi:hypothetical protein NYZ99_15195 [Maribacter litopenaei]|uniref:Transketolase, C-terminal domain n=1 Tax=Maribacter litopenaei TaxID=2976127 RepID=A0ABY5YC21_9FLAO|nr:transketolase C-terminal domain-containing protein [Maribacter litopenaei]UWX56620.1 hypothetical protein NYZ99_15195 [Maribacter litopenaei]
MKNDVCYSDNPVKLVAISAGVSYGALGTTHHSLHDFAALRAINNITIVAPADNFETEQAVKAAIAHEKPLYLRFGKKDMPYLGDADKTFAFGKGRIVREGTDLAIIANGETVYPALLAAQKLQEKLGLEATVVSMHTIKPLDTELLEQLAKNGRPIITVEEHMIYGGLGEACASHLFQKGYHNPFRIMAIPDEYTVTGSQGDIFRHYGISEDGIFQSATDLLNN